MIAKKDREPLAVLQAWDRLEVGPVAVEKRRLVVPYTVAPPGQEAETTELVYRWEEDVFEPGDAASTNLAAMIGSQLALNYGLFCRRMIFRGPYDERDRSFIETYAAHTAREIYVIKFLRHNPFLVGPAAELPAVRRESYLLCDLAFEEEPAFTAADRVGRDAATAAAGERAVAAAAARRSQPDADAGDVVAGRGIGAGGRDASGRGGRWATRPSGHAVLSSGGKDSLLSYGLLREMGRWPHSIFINESGRHWFSALNAYRYLSESDRRTARAWTNSDRLFAWMLRRLPFIRDDFARVRSDEYPIRLWTVAVFLFGALPLMRKRGLGRLVIGDEFDTTARGNHQGITHYSGLYDQSRWFDNAMSRYFRAKGWNVAQFSVLRPLSELLIEKVLVERYPELQERQLSCHAAHEEEGRIRPCGRCEKCRRIVGMLRALGADPRRCGYTEAQIEACLAAVAEEGVHQESAGAEHMMYLLEKRGVLPGSAKPGVRAELEGATLRGQDAGGGRAAGDDQDAGDGQAGGGSGDAGGGSVQKARPHPEVVQLRFDPERSPYETIPEDLREPLYRIFLEHADGAVERGGRDWVACEPLGPRALMAPYRFEPPSGSATVSETDRRIFLGSLTWPEASERLASVDIALLPVGAIEQHGAHLPLDTDAYDAERLAREVAEACSDPKPVVLPLVPYGVSYHHDEFRGTISVGPDTLARFVHEIGMAVAHNGVKKLVIINGHGGNIPALHFAAQMINRDAHIFTCVDSGESSDRDIHRMAETPNDVHAGEIETSTTLWLRPEAVQMDKARKAVPRFSSPYLDFTGEKSVGWYARTAKLSRTGVLGDPTKASREKGEKMWKAMVEDLVRLVEDLKRLTLDEIHQRKY